MPIDGSPREYFIEQDTFPTIQQTWEREAKRNGYERQCERVTTIVSGFFTRFPSEQLRIAEENGVRSVYSASEGLLICKMNI